MTCTHACMQCEHGFVFTTCGSIDLETAGRRRPRVLVNLIRTGTPSLIWQVRLEAAVEASEDDGAERGQLTPHGICCALAATRGFLMSRSGAPDAHRAALALLADVCDGAISLCVWPETEAARTASALRLVR